MNKDQIKGVAKKVEGKIQQKVGQIVDSDRQQLKGIAKQVQGNTQKAYGDAKEAAKKN